MTLEDTELNNIETQLSNSYECYRDSRNAKIKKDLIQIFSLQLEHLRSLAKDNPVYKDSVKLNDKRLKEMKATTVS